MGIVLGVPSIGDVEKLQYEMVRLLTCPQECNFEVGLLRPTEKARQTVPCRM